jgi:SAM-dependent methyltransferase
MSESSAPSGPKRFFDEAYEHGHASDYGGDAEDPGWQTRIRELTRSTTAWLERSGLAANPDAAILEIGCGLAYLSGVHPGWCGLEYSVAAVQRVKARDGDTTRIFEGDAQCLPFADESFDGVYSWAVLEHVPNPHKAFLEIDRVLRSGGSALIAPAWNCRPWTVQKLAQRRYDALSLTDKVKKLLIPVRESIYVRAVASLPGRLHDELRLAAGSAMPLRYKSLEPRWDLIEVYGHVSDDDALATIDPHTAVCFFKSRGYEIVSHRGALSRLMARHEAVVVRKRALR